MRIKATESLKKLKAMKTKRRKYRSFSEVDTETWTNVKCKQKYFGSSYITVVDWVNNHTNCFHSRSDESFWFESEKDAFKFRLMWGGDEDGEE